MTETLPPEIDQEFTTTLERYGNELKRSLGEYFAKEPTGDVALPSFDWHGLPVVIEQRPGDVGSQMRKVSVPYGYIRFTGSAEGKEEQMDCFHCGNEPVVHVIDSYRPDGTFDEHKCFLGAKHGPAAGLAFQDSYKDFRKIGHITQFSVDEFKHWLEHADLTKPAGKPIGMTQ